METISTGGALKKQTIFIGHNIIAPCLPLVPKYWEDIPEIMPEPDIYSTISHLDDTASSLGGEAQRLDCATDDQERKENQQPKRNQWEILLRRAVSRAERLSKEKRFERAMAQSKKAISAQKRLAKLAAPAQRVEPAGRANDRHRHSEFLSSLDWNGDDNELSVSVMAPLNDWNSERYQDSVLHRLQSMRHERDEANNERRTRRRMRSALQRQRTSRPTRGRQPPPQQRSWVTEAVSMPLSSTAEAAFGTAAANWMKQWISSSSESADEARTSRKSFYNLLRRF